MPDITLSVTISRTLLSLGALELNDHSAYYIAPGSPGEVTWQRVQVSSPFVDDDITVHRRRGKVTESFTVEVLGSTAATMATNLSTLLNAFRQDTFTLTSTISSQTYAWACEAADYRVIWDGPRWVSKQCQVVFMVPRSPIPISGSF